MFTRPGRFIVTVGGRQWVRDINGGRVRDGKWWSGPQAEGLPESRRWQVPARRDAATGWDRPPPTTPTLKGSYSLFGSPAGARLCDPFRVEWNVC